MGEVDSLIDRIHQKRKRSVRSAAFDAKDLTDRRQIEGVSPQAIEGVGREGHHPTTQNEADGVFQNVFEGTVL